jgi:hypothetical protein
MEKRLTGQGNTQTNKLCNRIDYLQQLNHQQEKIEKKTKTDQVCRLVVNRWTTPQEWKEVSGKEVHYSKPVLGVSLIAAV